MRSPSGGGATPRARRAGGEGQVGSGGGQQGLGFRYPDRLGKLLLLFVTSVFCFFLFLGGRVYDLFCSIRVFFFLRERVIVMCLELLASYLCSTNVFVLIKQNLNIFEDMGVMSDLLLMKRLYCKPELPAVGIVFRFRPEGVESFIFHRSRYSRLDGTIVCICVSTCYAACALPLYSRLAAWTPRMPGLQRLARILEYNYDMKILVPSKTPF